MPAKSNDQGVLISRMLSGVRAYLPARIKVSEAQAEKEQASLTRSAASTQAMETRRDRHGKDGLTPEGRESLPKPAKK